MKHLLTALLLALPGLAAAQSVQDQIVSQLTAQGFTRIEVSRTLLGRVKIEARSPTLERELVFNPATGEILRDYWEDRDDGEAAAPRVLISRPDDDDDDRRTATSSNTTGRGGNGGDSASGRDDDRDDDDRSGRGGDDDDDRSDDDDDRSDDDSGRGRGRGRGGDDDGDDD